MTLARDCVIITAIWNNGVPMLTETVDEGTDEVVTETVSGVASARCTILGQR